MEGVVVATQSIQDSLLGSNLVFGDVVWFAILGNRLALRRTSNHFGEFFSGGFGTEIEARPLGTR